jgi:hypothetical protein
MPSVGGYLPYEVGCPAFTRELRQVRWPSVQAFKPELSKKYDGKLNPAEFLGIYTIVVQAAGGRDEKVFTNYFPLVLKPNVRSWLMHLPENSISSWADFCNEFVGTFTGGHQEPGQPSDLQVLPQKEGEDLRKYIQRFSRVHRNIPEIHPAAMIAAFHSNVRNRRMQAKMNVRLPKTVNELYTLADKCARTEEGRRLPVEEAGIEIDLDVDDGASNPKGRN